MNFLLQRGLYYRSRPQGYTNDIAEAGLFTDDEARRYAESLSASVLPVHVQAEYLDMLERLAMDRLLRLRTLRMTCSLNHVADRPATVRSLMEDLRRMCPEPNAETAHRV